MANNNDGQIVLGLDIPKTVSQINDDIKKLEKQLEQVKATGALDTDKTLKQLNAQIKSLQAQLKTIEIKATVDPKSIQKTGQQIGSQIKNATKGSSVASEILNASDLDKQGKTYILKVSNTIEATKKEIQSKLRNSGYFDIEIKGVEKANGQIKSVTVNATNAKGVLEQLNFERAKMQKGGKVTNALVQTDDVKVLGTLSSSIDKVHGNLSTLKTKWEEQGVLVGDFKTKVEQLENSLASVGSKGELNGLESQIKTLKAEASQIAEVNKIQLLFDNGYGDSAYGNRIKQIENDFVKYGLSVDEASQKTQTLRNILNGFKDTDGNFLPDDKLVAQANKLETEFKAVKVSVDSAKLSYDKFLQPVSSDKASSLIIRINDFLTKNTAITKKAKEELLGFIRLLQNGNVNLSDWNKFDTRLKEINQEMRVAGKLGKSLKQTLIDGAKSFAQWTLSSGAVMEVWNGFKQGIRNVKELDDSLVELNKVTDLTVEGLSKVTEESFELGEKLAKTGTKVLDSVTSFSRAGYNIEDSMKYAEEALKTTNISENLKDAGQAADSLVNIMKGFQDETPEFAKKINDSVNQVSNTEAVDFDNLIDGATRLSAVADQAGMSFEQMLGTLTGAYEVLGNMEKVANGQITIFTRLQAIQMEGEEEVSTVAKLQDKFSNTTNGAVNIVDKTTGQLRNVYDILDDLSDVWDTLDKNTQEALAFEAAGTRQKNVFLSMMQNWQGVEDAVKSAENSIGSADEENQAYLNSLSGKLEDLESALQHISKTLIDSNLLKFFVDLGTTGVKSVDALIESLSPLGTLLTIGSGIAGAKGLGLTNYVTQS